MPIDNKNILIEEYHGCSEQVTRIDTVIWQTASIIFPINLAGFAYLGSILKSPKENILIVILLSLGSMALLLAWYLLSRAWYSYQSVAFYRMREIEKELGMWHYHYSFFIRQRRSERSSILEKTDESERKRFQKITNKIKPFPIGARLITAVSTVLFLFGWFVLIVYKLIVSV